MKKALSFLLTLVMALTVVAAGAFSVDAAENLFLRFDDLIAYVLSIGNKADIDSNDIGYWTFCQYDSVYGDDYTKGRWENGKFNAVEDGLGLDISYPADKFETVAHRLFTFDGTLKDMIEKENDPDSQLVYDVENNRYVYMLRGKGGIPFRVNGYIPQDNGSFDVYIQEGDFIEDGETYEEVWYDKYYKLNVSFDDVLTRVNSCVVLEELPSENLVAKPEYTYDCEDDIVLNADMTLPFPDGTHISAKHASDEVVAAAKKALANTAGPNMVVFDITATLNGEVVQPADGTVSLTFVVPETLSMDGLKLFHIDSEGKLTEITLNSVNKDSLFVIAELTHFSTYIFCNVGDVNCDDSLDTRDLVRLMKYIAVDGVGIEASSPDVNADGTVNTADLVRLMKMISEG